MNFEEKYNDNLKKSLKKVKDTYLKILKMVVNLSTPLPLNADKEFFFKNHPQLNNNVNYLLQALYDDVYADTVSGINTSWDIAVEKNNAIAEKIYGKGLEQLPLRYRKKYLSNNAEARRNFVYRKYNGLGLSDKIWKNTQQFKQELELSLEVGLGDGKSAQSIAKDVQKYLVDPKKLFRRVKDKENGVLRLSKAAKAYHPGRGKYRSSYKNAMRLTRNEINFSYEGSREEKRKQQDFIVGIEIKVSKNHKPADDKGGVKCIRLQGKYPKDFKWTHKWHVNCKCQSYEILKSPDELDSDLDRILSGEEPLEYSDNQVLNLPKEYEELSKDKKFSNNRTFANNKDYKERIVEKPVLVKPLAIVPEKIVPKKLIPSEVDASALKEITDILLYKDDFNKFWDEFSPDLDAIFTDGIETCTVASNTLGNFLTSKKIVKNVSYVSGEFNGAGHWFNVITTWKNEKYIIDFGNNIIDSAIKSGHISPKISKLKHPSYLIEESLSEFRFLEEMKKQKNVVDIKKLRKKAEIIIPPINKNFSNIVFNSVEDAEKNSSEWIASLDKDDLLIIKDYTKSDYRVINWKLRGVKDITTEKQKIAIERISEVLKNSPKIKTPSYRGITLEDTEFEKYAKLKKGDLYTDKGFISSSAKESVISDFTNSQNSVHFTIKGKSGTYINMLSDNEKELEILFDKGSIFTVQQTKLKKKGYYKQLFITLVEN